MPLTKGQDAQSADADLFPRLPRHPSLPEQIAEEIIRLAAQGVYALGERLPEVELAAAFGVSRVPVREALRLLESRGITRSTPNRGMRLMTVAGRELRHMLSVRASLERLAVREIAAAGQALPIVELRRSLDSIIESANADDPNGVASADLAFHRALCVASDNKILLDHWDGLSTKMMIIFGAATRTKNLQRLIETHTELFRCIESEGTEQIEQAIEQHIMRHSELDAVTEPNSDNGAGRRQ
jgi:DNA-binding GntR family transcriptional regulator